MASYHPDKQTPVDQSRVENQLINGLPLPPVDWLQHSERLRTTLLELIDNSGGMLSFRDYMQAVLYQPGLGYYSAAGPKFGEGGDFVTAPEVSPLFGFCVADFSRRLFDQGCAPQVLEFGAGSGKLCQQIMQHLKSIEAYYILEVSADLRRRQQENLKVSLDAETFEKLHWLDSLPQSFNGLVIANEVLDAMPVHLLYKQHQWLELGVTLKEGELTWGIFAQAGEAVNRMQQIEVELGELPEGYRSEINLNYQPWLAALAELPGDKACLLMDYGEERADYYRQSRLTGSLRCYFQHHLHDDPLLYPGLQDITADVDFDALADAAEAVGFELCGFTMQSTFLLNHGLLERAEQLSRDSETKDRLLIAQQVKSLTLPDQMGQRFKVLLLSQGLNLKPLPEKSWGGGHG